MRPSAGCVLKPGDVEDRLVGRYRFRDRDGSARPVGVLHGHRPPDHTGERVKHDEAGAVGRQVALGSCLGLDRQAAVGRALDAETDAQRFAIRPDPPLGDNGEAVGRLADVEPGEDRRRRSPVGVAHEEGNAAQDLDAAETDPPQRGPVEQGGKRAGDELARRTGRLQGAVDGEALGVGHPGGPVVGGHGATGRGGFVGRVDEGVGREVVGGVGLGPGTGAVAGEEVAAGVQHAFLGDVPRPLGPGEQRRAGVLAPGEARRSSRCSRTPGAIASAPASPSISSRVSGKGSGCRWAA